MRDGDRNVINGKSLRPIEIQEDYRYYIITSRRFDMGRLTFVFNQDRLRAENKTESDLLYPMRVFAQQHGIQETNNGVFELDGNNAFALLGGFVADITDEDHSYVKFLDKWELDVGGIVDDCIEDTLDWYKEEGIVV